MKAKNTIKAFFIFSLTIILTGLFSSCEYNKGENIKTKKTETKVNSKKELNSSNVTPTINEIKSGRFEKIKSGEKIVPIKETKTDAKEIKDATESTSGGGSAKGGTVTGANPLNM